MKLFGVRIRHTLLGCSLILSILGCHREPETAAVSGDVKVRIPFPVDGGGYSLQEIGLSGIESLYEFSGTFATFYIYPSLSNNKIGGYQPKTRFLKAEDIYVPQDILTQQVAVIYAHFQRLAALDRELGAGGVNTWPRDVGVAVRYNEAGKHQENNAFYDGATDAMLVVPYTQDYLPIAVNGGILAHEHFHSLYYKLVEKAVFSKPQPVHKVQWAYEILGRDLKATKPLPEDGSSFVSDYHTLFSRGINEGLADFWAWIYTGDPDFLQSSLPSEKDTRTLRVSEAEARHFVFPNATAWKARVQNRLNSDRSDQCRSLRVAYCLGTDYARTLKRYTAVVQSARGVSSLEARKIVGRAIVQALPALKDAFLSLKAREYFDPSSFFVLLKNATPELRASEKQFLEELFEKAQKAGTVSEKSVRPGAEVQPPRQGFPTLPVYPDDRGAR